MTLQTVGHGSTTQQPTYVSVLNATLAAGASTTAKQDAIIAVLTSLDGKDYATQATLAQLVADFAAQDFATEASLVANTAAIVAALDGLTFDTSGLATETTLAGILQELQTGVGTSELDPSFVSITTPPAVAPIVIKSGVSGTVSVPVGARLNSVSAQAPYNSTATVAIDAQDVISLPEGGEYDDSFAHSLEGAFDIVFTGTRSYYVTYYTGIIPAEVILL